MCAHSPPPAPKATRDALHSTVIPTLLFGGQSEVAQSLESTTDRAQGSPAELPSDKPLPGSARPPIDSNTRLENDGAATRQPPRPKMAGRLKMTRETMRSRRTLRDVTNIGASEAGVGKGAGVGAAADDETIGSRPVGYYATSVLSPAGQVVPPAGLPLYEDLTLS